MLLDYMVGISTELASGHVQDDVHQDIKEFFIFSYRHPAQV